MSSISRDTGRLFKSSFCDHTCSHSKGAQAQFLCPHRQSGRLLAVTPPPCTFTCLRNFVGWCHAQPWRATLSVLTDSSLFPSSSEPDVWYSCPAAQQALKCCVQLNQAEKQLAENNNRSLSWFHGVRFNPVPLTYLPNWDSQRPLVGLTWTYLICGLAQDLPSSQTGLFHTDFLLFMLTTNKLAAFHSDSKTEEPTQALCPVRAFKTFVELAAREERLFLVLWDGAHRRGTSSFHLILHHL